MIETIKDTEEAKAEDSEEEIKEEEEVEMKEVGEEVVDSKHNLKQVRLLLDIKFLSKLTTSR